MVYFSSFHVINDLSAATIFLPALNSVFRDHLIPKFGLKGALDLAESGTEYIQVWNNE